MEKNMNKKLQDQPNHGHYPYCTTRKKQIEKASLRLLVVSAASAGLMIMCTFGGIPLGLFTKIASAISGDSYMAFLMFSWLEILLLVFLASMNFFRSKAYGIPIFIFYAVLSVSILFDGVSTGVGVIPLFVGLTGLAVSWRVFPDYADQQQLENTEGYPFFNEIYTELTENPEYSTRYEDARDPGTIKKAYLGDSAMQELFHASDSCRFTQSKNEPAVMNDLFAPVENPEPKPELKPEPKPELKPEPKPKLKPEPVCEPAPEIKPQPVPEPKLSAREPEVSVRKYDKSILETSTSLFDDDYELPSIKPLYFQRMEEEKKGTDK